MAKRKHSKKTVPNKATLPKPAKSAPSFVGTFADNPVAAADKVADRLFPKRLNVQKEIVRDA